jgi:hypothetical protein
MVSDRVGQLKDEIAQAIKKLDEIYEFKDMGFTLNNGKKIDDAIDGQIEAIECLYDELSEIRSKGHMVEEINDIFNSKRRLRF